MQSQSQRFQAQIAFWSTNASVRLSDTTSIDTIDTFNKVIEAEDFLTMNGSMRVYNQLCGIFCHESNSKLLKILKLLLMNSDASKFTFPIAEYGETPVYLGYK